MTKAAKIRKLYAAGRPRKPDQKLSPITAYRQAGVLFEKLQRDMTWAELDPADARAVLVVNEVAKEEIIIHQFPVNRATIEETIPALLKVQNPIPVGVVCSIFDREAKPPVYRQWASPFLSAPAALATLQRVLEVTAAGKRMDS